jgi:HD superfamily phosphodiesterase
MDDYVFYLVQKARERLLNSPYDSAHEINHHYKVWENALTIISNEDLWDKVDLEVLTIASWYHDLERGSKTHDFLVSKLNACEIGKEKKNKIITVINSHSFNDEMINLLEAKILYDADKIEYFNVGRWENILESYQGKQMSEEKMIYYCNLINERFEGVVKNINFPSSFEMLKINLFTLINYLKSLPKDCIYSKKINLNLLQKVYKSL